MIRRALLGAALAALGCAGPERTFGVPSPILRPPVAASSPDEVFGFQAIVRTSGERFYGELVACDDAYVYLYVNDPTNPYGMVPWSSITHAEVHTPGGGAAMSITWAVVGTLSTATHGFFALLSFPIWGAVGAPSIYLATSREHVDGHCKDLQAYARYPQGLPPAIAARYWGLHAPPDAPFPGTPLGPVTPPTGSLPDPQPPQ